MNWYLDPTKKSVRVQVQERDYLKGGNTLVVENIVSYTLISNKTELLPPFY